MAAAASVLAAIAYYRHSCNPDPNAYSGDWWLHWVLSPATWISGFFAFGSCAALLLPARMHHAPARWIVTSSVLGVLPIAAYLGAVFGPYLLLAALGVHD